MPQETTVLAEDPSGESADDLCDVTQGAYAEGVMVHAFRLMPGQDLKQELLDFADRQQIGAAVVLTGVGSLTRTALRYAGRQDGTIRSGCFEIVSMVGTISAGGAHIHLSLSDENGAMFGGHLLDGCLIHTTAEIALAEIPGLLFSRRPDDETGYRELVIETLLPDAYTGRDI
ncbi:MAG: hypothetical protein OHK0029_27890 [Armatimonadaceae bacterium]